MPGLEDEIGDIISKARVGLGRSAARLAAVTGLSEREIGEIESYRLTPDRTRLDVLAQTLSLDTEKLASIAEGWTPAAIAPSVPGLTLHTVPVTAGGYGENCYIVACAETRAAAVVDPGGAADKIADTLAEHNLTLELALVTHAHGDHIGGLKALVANQPGIRLVNHQLERDSITRGLRNPWEPAKEGIPIVLGNLAITSLFTPGHTPGSTCYQVDGLCFVGDTLFAGSIGRPGAPTAYQAMLSAIRSKLLSLPDSTILLPGHGPATTVGEENDHNPFF